MPAPRHFRGSDVAVLEYEDSDPLGRNNKYKEKPQTSGIKIRISKERKVFNHLNTDHENTNLLFYDFNAYRSGPQDFEDRVPTRGGVKSRRELRQIYSA